MNTQFISLIIVAVLDFVFGFFLYTKGKKHPLSRVFGVFNFFVALWTFSVLMYEASNNALLSLGWLKLAYITSGFAGVVFWVFGITIKRNALSLPYKLLSIIPISVLTFLIAWPDFLLLSSNTATTGTHIVHNPTHYVAFFVLFVFYFIGGLWMVYRKLTTSSGETKKQVGYIFYSVLVAGFFGMVFNLFLPSPVFNNWDFIWLGPLFTFLIVFLTTIAITRHQLMKHVHTLRRYVAYWISLVCAIGIAVVVSNIMNKLLPTLDPSLLIVMTTTASVLTYPAINNRVRAALDRYFISSLGS